MQEELHIFLIAKDAYSFCWTNKKELNDSDSAWTRTILGTNDCDSETDCCDLAAAIKKNEREAR